MRHFSAIKHYIETHFGAVLLVSCALGLVVPGMPDLPNQTAILVLALLMFISCYRLSEGGFAALRWRDVLGFWVIRYMVLPAALWAVARVTVPEYAIGVFLLSVLPAGVSSPAISSFYGGAVAPGFAIVILSQLATPFLIPLQFAVVGQVDHSFAGQVVPSPVDLFMTMVWCIFVPMIVYAFVRKNKALEGVVERQSKIASMLLVAFVIALAIAKQRDILMSHVGDMAVSLVMTVLCFVMFMVVGWVFARKLPREARITYAGCSAFNNAALGVSLALLHFPPPIILFVAVSEIAWAMLPTLFSVFLRVVRAG